MNPHDMKTPEGRAAYMRDYRAKMPPRKEDVPSPHAVENADLLLAKEDLRLAKTDLAKARAEIEALNKEHAAPDLEGPWLERLRDAILLPHAEVRVQSDDVLSALQAITALKVKAGIQRQALCLPHGALSELIEHIRR